MRNTWRGASKPLRRCYTTSWNIFCCFNLKCFYDEEGRNWKCCNLSNSGAGHTCLQSACSTWNASLRSERRFRNPCCRKDFFVIQSKTGLLSSEGLFMNNFQLKWLRASATSPRKKTTKSIKNILLVIAGCFLFSEQEVCVGFGPLLLGTHLRKHNTWKNSRMCLVFFSFSLNYEVKDK